MKGDEPPVVVPLEAFFAWKQSADQMSGKSWEDCGKLEVMRLAHAGRAYIFLVRAKEEPVALTGDFALDGGVLGEGYTTFMPLEVGYMLDGDYREPPEIVVLPPRCKCYPEVLPGGVAIIASPGPYDTEISESRTATNLTESIGLVAVPTPSFRSLMDLGNEHTVEERHFHDGSMIDLAIFKPDTTKQWKHTHRAGGELLFLLSGEIEDGRQKLRAGHLCMNGPLTSHAPKACTAIAALTLRLGPQGPWL